MTLNVSKQIDWAQSQIWSLERVRREGAGAFNGGRFWRSDTIRRVLPTDDRERRAMPAATTKLRRREEGGKSSTTSNRRGCMKRPRSTPPLHTTTSPKRGRRKWKQLLSSSSRTLIAIELVHFVGRTRGDDTATQQSKEMYTDRRQSTSGHGEKGLVLTEDYCKRNFVRVSQMTVLCDTPGAYYYGSNAYRNSEVCMSGDKAKLNITRKLGIQRFIQVCLLFLKLLSRICVCRTRSANTERIEYTDHLSKLGVWNL